MTIDREAFCAFLLRLQPLPHICSLVQGFSYYALELLYALLKLADGLFALPFLKNAINAIIMLVRQLSYFKAFLLIL